jgi:hypothetical protein
MSRKPCAFSCEATFLDMVDRRASDLGMNRSQYVIQCIRRELGLESRPLFAEVREAGPVWKTEKKAKK